MRTKLYTEIDEIVAGITGFSGAVEDRLYEIKPLAWYLKSPLFGCERLYYAEDVADCDDFNDILKVYWLRRHWKKGLGPVAGGHWPALPTFGCKVQLYGIATPHWIRLVVCDEGVRFVERTEVDIREVKLGQIEKFLKVI